MNHNRLRILIVDDVEDDYFVTHAILVDVYGDAIVVDWISSYERAIESLLSGRHSLCLLDHKLGARTGLDLLRAVLSRGCPTPIIMLSGNADWELEDAAIEAGAADYLVKGQFGGSQLERSIRHAMGFAVERHQTLEVLRRSEERYRLAVRGTNDGLWDWDLTTDRIYYAPRWKSILGYEDGQIGDSILEWFNRVNPLDLERVKTEVSDHLAGKRPTSRPNTACSTETAHTAGFSPGDWLFRTTRERSSGWRVFNPISRGERRPRASRRTRRSRHLGPRIRRPFRSKVPPSTNVFPIIPHPTPPRNPP